MRFHIWVKYPTNFFCEIKVSKQVRKYPVSQGMTQSLGESVDDALSRGMLAVQ